MSTLDVLITQSPFYLLRLCSSFCRCGQMCTAFHMGFGNWTQLPHMCTASTSATKLPRGSSFKVLLWIELIWVYYFLRLALSIFTTYFSLLKGFVIIYTEDFDCINWSRVTWKHWFAVLKIEQNHCSYSNNKIPTSSDIGFCVLFVLILWMLLCWQKVFCFYVSLFRNKEHKTPNLMFVLIQPLLISYCWHNWCNYD